MKINKSLVLMNCSTCGGYYGIPEDVHKRRIDDGNDFYCYNGHVQHYSESIVAQNKRLEALLAQQRANNVMEEAIKPAADKSKEVPCPEMKILTPEEAIAAMKKEMELKKEYPRWTGK